ncbi:MAG: hypothetical protein PHV53_03000 [Fermentimonas sp.]|nr:hypothetical protein [Fermentimonas sp.]
MDNSIDLEKINGKIKVKNNQQKGVAVSLIVALAGVILTILTFTEGNPLYRSYAVTLLSIFLVLAGLIIALVLRSRAKKMNTLISGEKVIASWQLSQQEKSEYAGYLYQNEKEKNKAILMITAALIVIIFGIVIIIMGEGRGAMFLMMVALIAIIAAFAFAMPAYYRNKNLKGDGVILIGQKFAYVNGFFHNWDFPLSGIQKVKIIDKPFHGLYINYYYFDRTLKNSEELNIPASPDIDLEHVVSLLKVK